jgi:hypothetical protein
MAASAANLIEERFPFQGSLARPLDRSESRGQEQPAAA